MSDASETAADPDRADRTRRGILLMAGFAVGWFLVEGVLGGALHDPSNLVQIVWARYAVHIALVALIFFRVPFWRTERLGYQLARSALMIVMPMSFVASLVLGAQPDRVWAGFWIAPLLIVAAGALLLGERPKMLGWALAAAATVAAMALVGAIPPRAPLALLCSLAMAGSFAAYVAMTRSLQTETLAANLFYTAVVPFLGLTPFMPFVATVPTSGDALVMAGIGAVGLLTLFLLDRAAASEQVFVTAPVLALLAVLLEGALILRGAAGLSAHALLGAAGLAVIVLVLWSGAARSGAARRPVRG